MVSFQCNGCADVLTKPKLDKHRAMCNSSFDCIDCSKRFESPADYKGHTSCISEAEKYQKSLYNGGADPERNNRNQRSRQQGGGRQWGNNRLQWQQRSANKATGANDTPLGTPARMSPVNDTPVADENSQKDEPTVEVQKKRKAEPEATDSKDTSQPTKKKKKQKDADSGTGSSVAKAQTKLGKKRKSTPEVPITEGRSQDPVEDGDAPKEGGEKKRKEKVKQVKEDAKGEAKEKDKRKKKDSPRPGQESESGTAVDVNTPIGKEEPRSAKKKSKSKVAAVDEVPDASQKAEPSQATALEVEARDDRTGRKKRKKDQSGNDRGDDGDGKRVAEGNDDDLKAKRKEKKRKRKSESQP